MKRPADMTPDELRALPVRSMFGTREGIIGGQRVRIPYVNDALCRAQYHSLDDPIWFWIGGDRWAPVQTEEGWVRVPLEEIGP